MTQIVFVIGSIALAGVGHTFPKLNRAMEDQCSGAALGSLVGRLSQFALRCGSLFF